MHRVSADVSQLAHAQRTLARRMLVSRPGQLVRLERARVLSRVHDEHEDRVQVIDVACPRQRRSAHNLIMRGIELSAGDARHAR